MGQILHRSARTTEVVRGMATPCRLKAFEAMIRRVLLGTGAEAGSAAQGLAGICGGKSSSKSDRPGATPKVACPSRPA